MADRLRAAGLRVHVDDSHETLNYRIRDGRGARRSRTWRWSGSGRPTATAWRCGFAGAGKKQEVLTVAAFLERVTGEVRTRALVP